MRLKDCTVFSAKLCNAMRLKDCTSLVQYSYTLSGRIGKVVASHAVVARSSPADVALIYTMHVAIRGYCPLGWGVRPINWIYRL